MSRQQQRKFVQAKTQVAIIISLWCGLAFIVNQKWKNQIEKLGKVDDKIPILQLTRSKSKKTKKPRYESRKMVLNQTQDQTEKQQKYFRMAIK